MSKTCKCCNTITTKIPEDARYLDKNDILDGAYFECRCGSTLFIPKQIVIKIAKQLEGKEVA